MGEPVVLELVVSGTASPDAIVVSALPAWRPPRRLNLSAWADEHFYLSPESAAEPGRWKTLPYQRGIMDAITDPQVEQVTVMKSARVGYTKILDAMVGYYMHQDPCPIMIVQPTVEDAEGFSKEELAPMLRDCPVLAAILPDSGPKDGKNTILHKIFPGGSLSVVGANSGRGFRRVSRKVIALDEVDGYPPSAGSEGDQIKLAIRRGEYYWDRKVLIGSTPLVAGASRIAEEFEKGDQRRYHVPCPHCGHMDFLTFREKGGEGALADRGHYMQWPEGKPEEAHFVCRACGCVIEHKDKHWMVERGEWRAEAPSRGHASFHVWAAYSYSPNASWRQLAEEFLAALKGGIEKLKTFVNTVLGETWQERGEAPDYQRLAQRAALYERGTVPDGVVLITAGVDVQRDRLVWEVVGWRATRESCSIDAGIILGDTATEQPWAELDELVARTWPGADGLQHGIQLTAVDSGFQTQVVYNWARRHGLSRVIACKGVSTAKVLIGAPTAVDVTVRGKRIARGCKAWPVGVDIAKAELYGWLRLEPPPKESGAPYPPGFCHFPTEYPEAYYKQLTAEHLVPVRKKRTGFVVMEWQLLPGRENHWLDCRIYARAAAALKGLDRHAASHRARAALPSGEQLQLPARAPEPKPAQEQAPAPAHSQEPGRYSGWLDRVRSGTAGRRGNSWLGRRR